MTNQNDGIIVTLGTDEGNSRKYDVGFAFNCLNDRGASISVSDNRINPGTSGKTQTEQIPTSYFLNKWTKVTISIGYDTNGLPITSLHTTNEDKHTLNIKQYYLKTTGTVSISKFKFDWVELTTQPDTTVYIDDISVSGTVTKLQVNPLVNVPGIGPIGGLGGAAILGGFILIIAYSAYYFNLTPLPKYRKGRVSFSKRRR